MKGRSFFSLLCAALLALGWVCAGVLLPALDSGRFAAALEKYVQVLGLDKEDKAAFAQGTLDYLTGKSEDWAVEEALAGAGIPVSEAFRNHMEEMRHFVRLGRGICHFSLTAGAGLGLFLLLSGMKPSRKGWFLGLLLWPGIALCAGVWCLVDFSGFWGTLHRVFIPGGIFSSSEPLMKLFPLPLFGSYLPAVLGITLPGLALLGFSPLVKCSRKSQSHEKEREA